MKATTIMLPEDLRRRAQRAARGLEVSLAEYIRASLRARLDDTAPGTSADLLLDDDAIYGGSGSNDLAQRHDDHLYEDKA